MTEKLQFFTAGQFAKIHKINKKTLHYYDEIGLFSPAYRSENGYRYYTYQQSFELEFILALREIDMSIETIANYQKNPTKDSFLKLSKQQISDIDAKIKRLENIKALLWQKQEMLILSSKIKDYDIDLVEREEQTIFVTPFLNDTANPSTKEFDTLLEHIHSVSEITALKSIAGTYISTQKILNGNFEEYNGLFSIIDTPISISNIVTMPKGLYLRGFCIGNWDKIPLLYQKMLSYLQSNKLLIGDFAYEIGLNEITAPTLDEYVTQILIECKI